MIFGKFERTQWPVGHGGFHTGILNYGGQTFKYFYDCGAKTTDGRKTIEKGLKGTKFDFGVLSHFDNDHLSQLMQADVERVFLPYMTPTDILFYVISLLSSGQTPQVASVIYTQLKKLESKLVMVSHSEAILPPEQEPSTQGSDRNTPVGPLEIRGVGQLRKESGVSILGDNTPILVVANNELLVRLKFYNYRNKEVSEKFEIELQKAIQHGVFVDSSKNAFTSLDDFMNALKSDPEETVVNNTAAFKKLQSKHTMGSVGKNSTFSNLSSLALFTCTELPLTWHHRRHTFDLGRVIKWKDGQETVENQDGWMLTGDLELTETVWPDFYSHYFIEIEQSVVLNVPHHGSKSALSAEALHHLTGDKYFVFPVPSSSTIHPNLQLKGTIDQYKTIRQHLVTEVAESTLGLSVMWMTRFD